MLRRQLDIIIHTMVSLREMDAYRGSAGELALGEAESLGPSKGGRTGSKVAREKEY